MDANEKALKTNALILKKTVCWDKEAGKTKSNPRLVNTGKMLTDVGKYWIRQGFY